MIKFLSNFFKQSGIWIASSFFVSKIAAFLLTLFMARILSKEDLGWVMYGLNYLGFFIPFVGFGSSHGALRYAAIENEPDEKQKISAYSFSYGLIFNILLSLIMLVLVFILFGNGNQLLIISFFVIRLFGIFLLEQAKAEARGKHDNKKFGQIEIYSNTLLLVSAVFSAYFFGVKGYIFSVCLSPFVILFIHRFRISFDRTLFKNFTENNFWKFCVTMAFTNQVSELIFLLDVFFIGIFLDNSAVAHYRIYSIIPFNLFFLAALFFQTAYPKLCENHQNHQYQLQFLFNFWRLMVPITILIFVVSYFGAEYILTLFGNDYAQDPIVFLILIGASISVLLLRTPFGYLLASKGKSSYNLVASSISIISLLVFIKPIISDFGLEGVAWLSFINLLFTGIFLMASYFYSVYHVPKL